MRDLDLEPNKLVRMKTVAVEYLKEDNDDLDKTHKYKVLFYPLGSVVIGLIEYCCRNCWEIYSIYVLAYSEDLLSGVKDYSDDIDGWITDSNIIYWINLLLYNNLEEVQLYMETIEYVDIFAEENERNWIISRLSERLKLMDFD